MLAAWNRSLVDDLNAVHLFDLPAAATLYRVFVLSGCLQLDHSFPPAAERGQRQMCIRVRFGSAVDKPYGRSRGRILT